MYRVIDYFFVVCVLSKNRSHSVFLGIKRWDCVTVLL